jgi:hypothetical protein
MYSIISGRNVDMWHDRMYLTFIDAPPNSLIDSNAIPKVKTTKEGISARSLIRSTLGVKGCAKASGWRPWQMKSGSIIHANMHKPNNKLINV